MKLFNLILYILSYNCFLLLFIINYANCEWFSSLGQMEDLVHDEINLLSSLRSYIEAEETRLAKVKKFADEYQRISETAQSNMDRYLGHPVNQYRLVKRLATEWFGVEDLLTSNQSKDFLSNLYSKQEYFPDEEDVKGSAQALMRLQDTYKLDTHQLAQGVVKGMQANQSLTSDDCYFIGRIAYLDKDYHHCVAWMSEVLDKDEETFESFSKFDAMDHLSYCVAQLGNIQRAYEITLQMLEIDPTHERIVGNSRYYRNLLNARKKGDEGEDDSSQDNGRRPATYPERSKYERLCRSEKNVIPPKVERRLKCYLWNNNNHPRLLLQPVKLEELWDSPHLVRFYDIVTDYEIDVIKSIAKPRLYRATVQNPQTGVLEHANYRVSKSAWLTDDTDPVIARVCQRISDITGLSMATAEELQIANYGVGGQYEPHYDFARLSDAGKFDEKVGNRIATFLIYLSNIDYGGSTVFLHPGIAVRPIKRSAAFWFNLFPSGAGDLRTRHAACPVLAGVKWVSNKWIHERDQEFRRKCKLKKYADNRMF